MYSMFSENRGKFTYSLKKNVFFFFPNLQVKRAFNQIRQRKGEWDLGGDTEGKCANTEESE